MMRAGRLDRRIQFRRAQVSDDGLTSAPAWSTAMPEADNLGTPIWAAKHDISDSERFRAGEVAASITTRFTVRWSSFTRSITPADRLVCEGTAYEITGIKEGPGRREWLEITCSARSD